MNVCTICLLLTGLLLAPAPLWARVIRPASLSLVTGPVRLAVSDTFLITGTSGSIRQACSHPATATIDSCPLPAVLFPLGSAEPEPNQTEQMFTGLRHCQVSLTTPLAVTGHTCSLGTEATNLRLSVRLVVDEIQTTFRFQLTKAQLRRVLTIRNRAQVARHRDLVKENQEPSGLLQTAN